MAKEAALLLFTFTTRFVGSLVQVEWTWPDETDGAYGVHRLPHPRQAHPRHISRLDRGSGRFNGEAT